MSRPPELDPSCQEVTPDSRMGILFRNQSLPDCGYDGGGAARFSHRLLTGLSQAYPDQLCMGVSVANRLNEVARELPYKMYSAQDSGQFLRFLRLNGYEYGLLQLNDHTFVRNPLNFLALKSLWHKPIVFRLMSQSMLNKLRKVPDIIPALYLNQLDAIIAQSSEIRDSLVTIGVRSELVHQIPNGIDTDFYSPMANQEKRELLRQQIFPNIDTNALIYIYTGRVCTTLKRVDRLLKTWVQNNMGSKGHRLLMVGTFQGVGAPGGEELFRIYGKHPSIRWAGLANEAEVVQYLQMADVFVLPSDTEGFSNSLLEAMSVGLPVLAKSGVSGVSDLVTDGKTGRTFTGDADFSNILLNYRIAEQRADMGSAARNQVLARFSINSAVQAYFSLYTQLLSN